MLLKSTCIDIELAAFTGNVITHVSFKKRFLKFRPPEEEEEVGYPQPLGGVIPG